MSRFRGALPGGLLATVCGVLTGIATFRPALQQQADKRTFEYLQQQEKLNSELGPDMTEVKIADGLAVQRRGWEMRGEESASALALLEAEKTASRPPVE